MTTPIPLKAYYLSDVIKYARARFGWDEDNTTAQELLEAIDRGYAEYYVLWSDMTENADVKTLIEEIGEGGKLRLIADLK